MIKVIFKHFFENVSIWLLYIIIKNTIFFKHTSNICINLN